MNRQKVYTRQEQIDFSINEIEHRIPPDSVLMCSPDFFDIIDVKNPHMAGKKGMLFKELAIQQWTNLKAVYTSLVNKKLLKKCATIPGAEDCEDMVFAANQTFPWLRNNEEKVVIMSKMKHPSRQKEVVHYKRFFESQNYKILELKHPSTGLKTQLLIKDGI